MASNYIWRDKTNPPDADDLEATDYIAFEIANSSGSDQGHIHQTEFKIITALADNEKPNAKLNEIQDTQLDSITITITGSIHINKEEGASVASSLIPQKIKEWMCDEKTTTAFPKGRFGLKLANFTPFNVYPTPSSASALSLGYMIQDWTWLRVGETQGKAEFIATLRLNGEIGVGTYNWAEEETP